MIFIDLIRYDRFLQIVFEQSHSELFEPAHICVLSLLYSCLLSLASCGVLHIYTIHDDTIFVGLERSA